MNVKEFIEKHGIRMVKCEWAERNPHMERPEAPPMNHFKVTLGRDSSRMTLTFSKGLGLIGAPTTEEVINSLLLDANCVRDGQTFEDFCDELGYNPDSRRDERLFKAVCKEAERLEKFLGPDAWDESASIETD